ncbi:MAG TPA: hypothetical protein VGD76_09515 [Ramlibacter sp.]
MEKAAVTGTGAGSRREAAPGHCIAVLAAMCIASPAVAAAAEQGQQQGQASAEVLVAEARADQPGVRVQVRTSSLPRLEGQDSGFQAPRIDLSLTPSNSHGFGAVLGVSGFSGAPAQLGLQPQRPSVDFGLRWSQKQIDVMAWRRMSAPDDAYSLAQMRQQPVYGARVEMNLAAAAGKKNKFGLDRGFLGMQLEGGARISIKRKYGGPMVYYRTSF